MASFYWITFFLVCLLFVLSTARRTSIKETGWTQTKYRVPEKVLEDDFWCPTCQMSSEESCDASLVNTTCPKAHFCMALWNKDVFSRKCINRKMLKLLTKDCRNVDYMKRECKRRKRRYHLSWCNQPGCKAEVTEIPRGKPERVDSLIRNNFWCPTCQSTSQESCEATLANTTCPKADFCIALWDTNIFTRKCVNRRMRELMTKDCQNVASMEWKCNKKRKYHLTSCAQAGCKAEFSEITVENPVEYKPVTSDFWCPTCQSTSQESCEATLVNTTCPKANHCMALWDKNVFLRKCVNRKMLELITKDCRNVDSKQWECHRKRKYHVTACERSGCIAKVSGSKVPFQCPTCPICKSPKECDHKTTIKKCPTATRCMVLHFNGTVDTQGIFTRKCINENTFIMIQRACTYKQGCEVSSCTQSGCIATL